MLSWLGGYCFSGTIGFFTQKMEMAAPVAFFAIAA
jgi:hypothetical protein